MLRHGWVDGYALEDANGNPANESLGAAANKTVSGRVFDVSADIDELAVVPFGTASATDAGVSLDFEFVGQMADGATYDTNPMIVRVVLDATGLNKGPVDKLPVTYYRRVKLNRIVNNSAAKTLTGINAEIRYARSRS
jgi:hypothetical protein